jgi:hypothetical protein
LLLLTLIKTTSISIWLLEINWLGRVWLAVEPSCFALGRDLLADLFFDLLQGFKEELLNITSLV